MPSVIRSDLTVEETISYGLKTGGLSLPTLKAGLESAQSVSTGSACGGPCSTRSQINPSTIQSSEYPLGATPITMDMAK